MSPNQKLLPASCPAIPTSLNDFPQPRLDDLRTSIAAAGAVANYKAIVPGVDNKVIAKFVHRETSLDYRQLGPQFQSIFRGGFQFYKRVAPEFLVTAMRDVLARIYMPRQAIHVEQSSRVLHALYGVADFSPRGSHGWLPGNYGIYREGDVVDGIETITKSVMTVAASEDEDHRFLSFKIVYPSPELLITPERLRDPRPLAEEELLKVHGIVLPKHGKLFFVGRDGNGDVPYQITADDPIGRSRRMHGVLMRLGSGGVPFTARVLIIRLDDGHEARSFRALYPNVGVFGAKELISRDGLGDCAAALSNGGALPGPLRVKRPGHFAPLRHAKPMWRTDTHWFEHQRTSPDPTLSG